MADGSQNAAATPWSARRAAAEAISRRGAVPHVLLLLATAAYILSLFVVSALPGLSRIVHGTLLVMMLALLTRAWTSRMRLQAEPLILVAWAFFTFAAASVLWSANQQHALVDAAGLFFDVLGATLIWLALQNGIRLASVGVFVGVGAAVQAIIALSQYASGEFGRAIGLTGNANALAIQLSLASFILLAAMPRDRWAGVFALALVVVATVVSGSRKMVFVWLAYIILWARDFGIRLRARAFAGMVLLLLPVVVVAALSFGDVILAPVQDLLVYERIERTITGEESSAVARENLGRDALRVWLNSPYIGHGIDQYRLVGRFDNYSHNNYTELLANFGIVGFLLYYALPFSLLVWVWPRARKGDRRAWLVVAAVMMMLLLDVGLVSYASRMTWLIFAVLIFVAAQRTHRT